MRKIIFMLAAMVHCLILQAQMPVSCCSPTQQFALLANNENFRAIHKTPKPFILHNAKGETIHFTAADGKEANAYLVKSPRKSKNYLLVFHEWWGLNDYIKQMSDKLQQDLGNVNVIALDLYDGKIATSPEEAGKYMQEVSDTRARAIISGALKYIGSQAKIYTIGWCFGGGWSLQATLMAGKQAGGCVMYYGLPENNINKLKTLSCDVLGIFADKDDWITPALVSQFKADMDKAGKKLILHHYNAYHGFANPSAPQHNGPATQEAYGFVLQFLKARLH